MGKAMLRERKPASGPPLIRGWHGRQRSYTLPPMLPPGVGSPPQGPHRWRTNNHKGPLQPPVRQQVAALMFVQTSPDTVRFPDGKGVIKTFGPHSAGRTDGFGPQFALGFFVPALGVRGRKEHRRLRPSACRTKFPRLFKMLHRHSALPPPETVNVWQGRDKGHLCCNCETTADKDPAQGLFPLK